MPVMVPDPNNPGKMIEIPADAFEVKAVPEQPQNTRPREPQFGAEIAPTDQSAESKPKKKKKKKKKKVEPQPHQQENHVKDLLA